MVQAFESLLALINISYMICVILSIYFIIKVIDNLIDKPIPSWWKSIIVVVIGIIFFVVFKYFQGSDIQVLTTSFVVSTFGYDIVIKPVLKKFGINYKDYFNGSNS